MHLPFRGSWSTSVRTRCPSKSRMRTVSSASWARSTVRVTSLRAPEPLNGEPATEVLTTETAARWRGALGGGGDVGWAGAAAARRAAGHRKPSDSVIRAILDGKLTGFRRGIQGS